jgi:hypothetical protein
VVGWKGLQDGVLVSLFCRERGEKQCLFVIERKELKAQVPNTTPHPKKKKKKERGRNSLKVEARVIFLS